MGMKTTVRAIALAWTMALLAVSTTAQERAPIRLLVGFAPGGVSDSVARLLAEGLKTELSRPVLVDNKIGAGGRVAAEALKAAAPDGSTYMMSNDGWAIFPTVLYPAATLRYSVLSDMVPVARVVSYPLALVVNQVPGASDARQYAAWLKANPSKAVYGTAGAGGQTQFIGTTIGQALGTPMTVVPYKGNGPLMSDMLGGQIPAGVMVAGDALKQRSDNIRVLAVLSRERWALAPGIPTLLEQGFDVTSGMAWQGIWAPAGTPRAETQRMEAALQKVLSRADIRDQIIKQTWVMPDFAPGAELDRQLRAGLQYWEPIIKASGYKPE